MKTIGQSQLWGFFDDRPLIQKAANTAVRNGSGHFVSSYMELAKKIAEVQFMNPAYELLFRGQARDYKNRKGNSTLKPTLLRSRSEDGNRPPSIELLARRFDRLEEAEQRLVEVFDTKQLESRKELRRQRILRWAMLQHYEVCDTPLLDVSRSIRIAASFASSKEGDSAYLFVLAVPSLGGALSVSIDSGLQTIKLSAVCPPSALRPHIQEGYLLGEFPEMAGFDQKRHYESYETDFGRRLVAKFRMKPVDFWSDENFPQIPQAALYPDQHDSLYDLLSPLKAKLQESA